MRFNLISGAFLFFTLTGFGCSENSASEGTGSDGGEDGNTDVAADTPIPFEEMCDAFIHDACKAIFACPSVENYFDYKDEAACREDLPCRGYGDLAVSFENGWFSFDSAAMGACHAMILSDLCGVAVGLPSNSIQGVLLLCPDVIQGNQGTGDPCLDLADCERGSYCHITDQCPGVCVRLLESGSACDTTDSDPNRRCNELDGLVCIRGTCRELLTQGENCLDYESYCGPGLICGGEINGTAPPTCVPLGTAGDLCESNSDCEESLVCVPTDGATANFQCGAALPLGAYCEWNSQCGSELFCVNYECILSPGLGRPCTDYLFGGDNGGKGFICNGDQCVTAKYIGEPCGQEMETCAESRCDQGICAERLPDGAPCTSAYECHSRSCSEVCYDSYMCEAQTD